MPSGRDWFLDDRERDIAIHRRLTGWERKGPPAREGILSRNDAKHSVISGAATKEAPPGREMTNCLVSVSAHQRRKGCDGGDTAATPPDDIVAAASSPSLP